MGLLNSLINTGKALKNQVHGRTFVPSMNLSINLKYMALGFIPWGKKTAIECILCGYPRSGTHWIRNVIEKSSGQKTYDLFSHRPDADEKKILAVKVHARNKVIAQLKSRVILPPYQFSGKYIYSYRDPRDTIISLFEMYKKKRNVPNLDAEEFIRFYDPIRQYRWEINSWVLSNPENVMQIKFEDLKQNPVKQFERIFDYIGLTCEVKKETIQKKVSSIDGSDRPRATSFGWKKAPEDYEWLIKTTSEKLEKEIDLLGYDSF